MHRTRKMNTPTISSSGVLTCDWAGFWEVLNVPEAAVGLGTSVAFSTLFHPRHTYGYRNLVCSGCNVAFYCSKDCQKDSWPFHKRSCQSIQARTKQTRETGSESDDGIRIRALGFTDSTAFAKALSDWIAAHQWALKTAVQPSARRPRLHQGSSRLHPPLPPNVPPLRGWRSVEHKPRNDLHDALRDRPD
ncbi:hypothetical protein C8Q77DRAFT_569609 [Trametes polyzona]|nr:hypothetical protein C8Q77DRAFT_569609 [Trametes polyzona]